MICLGNICRSPTAQAVFEKHIESKGLEKLIEVDSAGTGGYHIGEKPDPRSMEAAAARAYSLDHIRSRKVDDSDYEQFDYILAMDKNNLRDMQAQCPPQHQSKLRLFLEYGDSNQHSVPDPYYTSGNGFDIVLDLVEGASAGLLQQIIGQHLPHLNLSDPHTD